MLRRSGLSLYFSDGKHCHADERGLDYRGIMLVTMDFQVAQLNIGRLLHPIDHPQIAEFVNGLEEINSLAERSAGFVWRFQTASGNATDAQHPWSADPFMLANMSIWKTPEDLKNFVYRSSHLEFFLKRAEWFEKMAQAHYVLWWVPSGHIPSLAEAQERLEHYRQHGATPYAFWFGKLFPAESSVLVPAEVSGCLTKRDRRRVEQQEFQRC